ncbi:Uncharacterized conserved protein YloU, alkaline shock protein (Asp23) family [Klenkia soli]|uniref:Uncharacterized conserved protein YloU, alkaline shock protein (Asp23) family n=1 Tax=Klenkia soli TaxID=1052260 RepID=A0A1H0EAF1_9ACTN|nr:Asp23/Gls24 family envelope stress response protein [Klenkia soli]SDN79309.1 Uncharacterized conserved protein YloU, alkaline shock protein (Asp23) family [Klenkia soli]
MTGDALRHDEEDPVDGAELDGALRELAAEAEPVPSGLAGRVVERVDGLAGHDWHAVLVQPGGRTRVAGWVVALVARRAAAAVDGVGGATSRASADGVDGVVVELGLTVRAGVPLPSLAEQVRRSVVGAVRELTGVEVVAVDVHVDDLVE